MPVPPPAAVNIPDVVALNVNEPLVLVMYMPVVRPLLVAPVVVPSEMFPVCAVPYVCAIVIEVVADCTQVPPIEKQPLVRFTPLAKVEEAVAEVALKMEAERPAAKVEVAVVLVETK